MFWRAAQMATKAVEYKASRALFDLTRPFHRESYSYSDQKSARKSRTDLFTKGVSA